ncbi:nitroreductase family deazaflavin-dependent oxidoreductase [Mycobacterium sp. Aquia_213]|uniref:nitroreductase family deazaflavin-dependent oxidoreductase n=1 Tax=Mycobacterium sp. Aquia_213 TaxID=2991728 RepID=UPI00226F281E|nr:nitroreductase family deazaflavin-dependent oxidoreductase [Mycobacterium sp. Aquia_213]WAC93269.1 nitroreductase family deazaflavin-dependent oxidoreductase [Mycobacterium sp. Aquia_213]
MQEFDPERFRTDTVALKTFDEQIIREFRENNGKVGGVFENIGVLLLTTTGAKSGLPRMTPLAYFTIDRAMVVVGSRGGAPKDPAWAHNLRATPQVRVEVGTESFAAIAREAKGAERDSLFGEIVSKHPNFGVYQGKTTRTIPVFTLQRSN